MSTNVIQTSFASGELSPTLYARVDLAQYHIGAARMSNFFVDYRGGASNRPGFELVARALNRLTTTRLIPFQFSTVQNYILEFGDFYMRVIKNGALVLEASKIVSAATNANPGIFTSNAHGYLAGDQVELTFLGMTQVNSKDYFIANPTTNTFQLTDWSGNILNTAGFGVFISGTVARVLRIVSPYAAADLALLKFIQSADVMTLTHPDYVQRNLTRSSDTTWTFTAIVIGATIGPPAGTPTAVVSPATGGTTNYSYVVTSVDENGQESIASAVANAVNGLDISATAGSVNITWAAVVGAVGYNVYKALPVDSNPVQPGILYGFMTSTDGNGSVIATDTNIVPDFTTGPPTHNNPFPGNNPATVTYDQQRKVYAGSDANPETFWMSKPGQFDNFDISNPVQASDSITGTLVSRQVNQIKYMVSMPNGLIMLTSGGAWQISGAGGILSPTTVQAVPQAYNGCGDVPPLTINYEIIYVQAKGTIVRDLSYSFYTNIYTGSDLSILSNHLFTGYSILEWAYAEEPFKIIWAVRSDGALLSLTYLKDEKIAGWARHETQGRFKSIATIPEGQEDVVYCVVQRWVQGELVSFIERMHSRLMPYGVTDAFFLDCAVTTEGTQPGFTLTFSDSTGTIRVTADGAAFDPSLVGDIIQTGGGVVRITEYLNSSNVNALVLKDLTDVDNFRPTTVVWPQTPGQWILYTSGTTFSGLDHLEGETVGILADGNVVTPQVVNNGSIILSQPAAKVTVGLAYTAQLQTLYLDVGEPTIQGKRKNIIALTARVFETRGLEMGQTFDDLTEYKDRDLNTIGLPIDLFTGDQRIIVGGGWNVQGQICIEQANPLPATILGVIPEIAIGDTDR